MKLIFVVAIVVLTLVGATTTLVSAEEIEQQQQHYYNYTVYRLRPQNLFQLNILHLMEDEVITLINDSNKKQFQFQIFKF